MTEWKSELSSRRSLRLVFFLPHLSLTRFPLSKACTVAGDDLIEKCGLLENNLTPMVALDMIASSIPDAMVRESNPEKISAWKKEKEAR
jgi:hypothetical protein